MRLWRFWRTQRYRGAILGLACGLACWLLNSWSSVRVLEDWALDNHFIARGRRSTSANVKVVAIDETSLRELGKPLMFSSPELAEVISHLRERGALAIGVDILLPESKETMEYLMPGGPGDAETMGRAVSQAGNVVLPMFLLPEQKPVLPMYEWQRVGPPEWSDLGFVNLTVDTDTYVRRQLLRADGGQGCALPSFALSLFGRSSGLPAEWIADSELDVTAGAVPLDRSGRMLINYVGPPGTIERIPFHRVLSAARGNGTLDEDFAGAVVVIGMVADTAPDRHATPYLNQSLTRIIRSDWFGHEPQLMAGAEIHANVVATLSDGAFITTPWWLATPWLLLLNGTMLGYLMARLSLTRGVAVGMGHHVAWRGLCLLAFWGGNWHVEMVAMLFLGAMVYSVTFISRWRWMRRMLGMVKSEAIARALEADPHRLHLIGEQKLISILFSDIRNFTTYSEKHSPTQVVRLLNEYFTAVVPVIEGHRGTIAQYNGDGVMVIFGALEDQPDHARRAVRAAIAMVERVHQLSDLWQSLDAPSFQIGVGVHSGDAVTGAVGSPHRLDFTAHGDSVNTASRIESGNKQLHSEVLISRQTLDLLDPAEQNELSPRLQPHEISAKGKQQMLTVYAVAFEAPTADDGNDR